MKKIVIFISLMLLFSCAKKVQPIAWEKNTSFAEILESAGEKYVMMDFVRDGCSWCVRLDVDTFTDLKVIKFVNKNLKAVKMHADSVEGKTLIDHYKISGFPTIVFVDKDSTEIDRIVGYRPPKEFLSELKRIKYGKGTIPDLISKTKQNPDDFEQWTTLASKYEDRGDLQSAYEVWESVSEANIGDSLFVEYKLVELNGLITKDIFGMEEYFVNNLNSEYSTHALRTMTNILRRSKDTNAEVETWKKYISQIRMRNSDAAALYNSFAWRMSELEQNLNLAVKKIRYGIKITAKEDSSTLAGYMDTEAEILWKMGNIEWAVIVIDKCIALQPDDKYFKDQKAKILED